jgi:hypothetical protein
MGREELELLRGGIVKRKTRRHIGLFIDATGLDRATRRLERKVDLASLVKGLTSGLKIEIARYYSLIPYEDDARQFAFLDAVERAGVEVVTKRLPPKGVKRQVSMDVHIAADMISYAYGHFAQKAEEVETKAVANGPGGVLVPGTETTAKTETAKPESSREIRRVMTVVCPSRELSYALYMSNKLGVETSLADFGLYGTSDGWKGVDRWVDLSTSETIWRS